LHKIFFYLTNNRKIKDLEFQDVGIAAFGPINLNIDDSYYGFITTTPKIG
jgi:hypothetical protein